ncbi:ufd2 [Candida oxycetoniae]|uniref:RING-type E3 ubiquitin transferase n=1 Tax=Candida oxycetoniae TaxID=497107 RepID=A0AAI9SWY7_9ASCO|nr:ufd2 [Candida oxycetoniae]KAI3404279.2 ufd2 [Candida oxycetoniae]
MSSADEIRSKRLAKLAALSSSNATEKSSSTEKETNKGEATNKGAAAHTEAAPSPTPRPKPNEEHFDWAANKVSSIFNLPPSSDIVTTAHQVAENEIGKLDENYLDEVFMELLNSDYTQPDPLSYIYPIYQRAYYEKRELPVKSHFYNEKIAFLSTILKHAVRYANMALQFPDMFAKSNLKESVNFLIEKFSEISPFLMQIIQEAIEDDGVLTLLNLIFPTLSVKLIRKESITSGKHLGYMRMFEALVSLKPVAAIFSQVDGFFPSSKQTGLEFEWHSLLGPVLRLSPLDASSEQYFGTNPKEMSQPQLNSAFELAQSEYRIIIDHLFTIVDKLIRGSTKTREDVLKWLADLVNLSHLRRGSHADFTKLPSDGLMLNITVILIKLSQPFLDYPVYAKINKIDVDYFAKSKLLDISEEARVNSSIDEANTYSKQKQEENGSGTISKPNFISDCFNLTLAYVHYGMGGIYIKFDRLKQNIKQSEQRIAMIESGELPGTTPLQANALRAGLPRMKKAVGEFISEKYAIQAIFSLRGLQLEIFDFVIGATVFITRMIDPNHAYPQKKLSIPIFRITDVSQLDDHDFLKTKTPEPWKYYPEFLLEGLINYCKFSVNFRGCPLVGNEEKLIHFVEFTTILLRCPELIGNPHMKANLVEILFIGSLPGPNGQEGFSASIFRSDELILSNLLYSLLDFYVMVEKTGASSQFYDKFNSRYYISVILEELWKTPHYRFQLKDYSENNVEFFIRFIARMLNDTTYLLDESFNLLNSIHDYQVEMKRRLVGEPTNEEMGSTEELSNNLESAEKRAKSLMSLSNKTIELFKLFTREVPQGFVLPELVDRLAGMLDFNLSVLVGPKCSNLKVEAPEKYDFEPKKVLSDICEVYVNLSSQKEFVVAVSRDGRSFNISYFEKAENILTTRTFVDNKIIDRLRKFSQKAEENRKVEENEELELGEVPDEFLDPLMFTLMEDPVILPSSKISIDRSTIKAHLLSDATDPFNRMPLKLENVIDDVELKEKINAFKKQKKEAKQNNGDVTMSS